MGWLRAAVIDARLPEAIAWEMTPVEIRRAIEAEARRHDREMQKLAWAVAYIVSPHVKGRVSPQKLYRSPYEAPEHKPLPPEKREALSKMTDATEIVKFLAKEARG